MEGGIYSKQKDVKGEGAAIRGYLVLGIFQYPRAAGRETDSNARQISALVLREDHYYLM